MPAMTKSITLPPDLPFLAAHHNLECIVRRLGFIPRRAHPDVAFFVFSRSLSR
jgi:hypothetical protein